MTDQKDKEELARWRWLASKLLKEWQWYERRDYRPEAKTYRLALQWMALARQADFGGPAEAWDEWTAKHPHACSPVGATCDGQAWSSCIAGGLR